jgi:hypothetical protein
VHNAIVEPSETFLLPSGESVPARSQGVSCWMTMPCGPHCPEYTALHVLEGTGPVTT